MNAEQDAEQPIAAPPAGTTVPVRATPRPKGLVLAAVALAMAIVAFAYRALLTFRPTGSISVDVEGWFFEPSDTSPSLVVALSLWLLYRRAPRLAALPRVAGPHGLTFALYVGALAVFVWALRTEASDLQAISLILLSLGTTNLVGGRAALRVVWLPVVFLLFALPIPSPLRHAIVWKFQIWTADATGFLLYLLGIPVVVSGDRIVLADNVFAVIETCSGLRSVITLSMLAVLMVDLFRRSGLHAALILVFAPFLAFGTNALRALGLVLNPKSDVASIHSLQGIGMLLASVLVLYAFDGLLERLGVPGSRSARVGRRSRLALPIARRLAAVVALLALLAALSIAITPWRIASPELPLPVDTIDRRLGPWHSMDLETDRLFLGMAALTGSVHRRYSRAGDWVNVFVAAGSPRLRFRSFYTAKTSLPGSGWIIEQQTRSELDGRALDVLVVRRGAERRLVHHWHVGTRGFGEELLRETLALDASPLARAHRGVVVRLETPLESLRPRGDAEALLEEIRGYLLDSLEKSTSDPGGRRSGTESTFHFSPRWEKYFFRYTRLNDHENHRFHILMVYPGCGTRFALYPPSYPIDRGKNGWIG